MTETTKQGALLEDSTFNVTSQLEKKADFLYTSVEKYMRDAEKDNKPELIKMWNTIKEDEQNHLKMLREELVREVKENKLKLESTKLCCAPGLYSQHVRHPLRGGKVLHSLWRSAELPERGCLNVLLQQTIAHQRLRVFLGLGVGQVGVEHYPGDAGSALRTIKDISHDFVFLSIAHPDLQFI